MANFFQLQLSSRRCSFGTVHSRFLKYWLPLLLWMGIIFSASTSLGSSRHTSRFIRPFLHWLIPGISEKAIDQVHTVIRKTAHFTEYAMLGFLIWRVVANEPGLAGWTFGRQLGLALLLSALYAASDEAHQIFVPGREASVRDVFLDTCGAGGGLAVVCALSKSRKPKN